MIEKGWGGNVELICDNSDCRKSETFDVDGDFAEAVRRAKEHGWRITKSQGQWVHICWKCNKL